MLITLQSEITQLSQALLKEHAVFYPTSYATAWVSRVPELHQSAPAFPAALNWLRTQQLADGSWGTLNPLNPFANTLATLAVLLALYQWHFAEDEPLIKRGQQALINLGNQFNHSKDKTFGFELLLVALLEEFQTKQLHLPANFMTACQPFLASGEQQRHMLKNYLQQTDYQNVNIFWLCLEMLGGSLLTDQQQPWPITASVLNSNGSLLASTAASAYLLAANRWRGQDVPDTFTYLKNLVQAEHGGIPPYHPMEQYELTFALDFLLKGNIPLEDLNPLITKLHSYWQQRNGLGYSCYSPSLDADDTALGLISLKKAGINVDYHSLLEFFNGEYFYHYREDPTPSVSVNANALRALQFFHAVTEVQPIINKTLQWIDTAFQTGLENVLQDAWHSSPYYAVSAIIFALTDLAPEHTHQCVDWLLKQQRNDGGWGYDNISTVEETALAVLALSSEQQRKKYIQPAVFAKAKKFIDSTDWQSLKQPCLYKGTTLVCPFNVVKATILAAVYAIHL